MDDVIVQQEDVSRYTGPAQTAAVRAAISREILGATRELLRGTPDKVPLADTERVRETADRYMEMCERISVCPSLAGLAGALGVSRNALYKRLRERPEDPTCVLIERLRTVWTGARIAMCDRGLLPESTTIFLLKNSGQGYSDLREVELIAPSTPLDGLDSEEARRRLVDAIPDEE